MQCIFFKFTFNSKIEFLKGYFELVGPNHFGSACWGRLCHGSGSVAPWQWQWHKFSYKNLLHIWWLIFLMNIALFKTTIFDHVLSNMWAVFFFWNHSSGCLLLYALNQVHEHTMRSLMTLIVFILCSGLSSARSVRILKRFCNGLQFDSCLHGTQKWHAWCFSGLLHLGLCVIKSDKKFFSMNYF